MKLLETHLRDNMQAWQLEGNAMYRRLTPARDERPVNSQEEMIRLYARQSA